MNTHIGLSSQVICSQNGGAVVLNSQIRGGTYKLPVK